MRDASHQANRVFLPRSCQVTNGRGTAGAGRGGLRDGAAWAQQPSYGAQGAVPAWAYSSANAASCTLAGAVCAPPG